jgi:hypothetical protein
MTWGIKVGRVTIAVSFVGALALASGANWIDWFLSRIF